MVVGVLVFAAMLYLVFRGFDYGRFFAIVRHADLRYVLAIPATILVEQVIRAWKWRQFLAPITPASGAAALRALMAGYVPGLAVGLGTSVLTRAWLIARRDPNTTTGAVIATVTVDRLVDSIAFVLFVALTLIVTPLPASADALRLGLALGGAASFIITVGLLLLLFRQGHRLTGLPGWLKRRLPRRWSDASTQFIQSYARGISWPRGWSSSGIILLSAFLIKLFAVAQFLWAGLAIGILMPWPDYLFIMVFLGLWVVVGFVIQIPGSWILATVFILGLFHVQREQALAMILMVSGSFLLSYGGVGALALWLEGLRPGDLKTA